MPLKEGAHIMGSGGERTRTLQAGESLFRQGDAATFVFAIEQGQLRLERRTFDGRLVPLHLARAGETFAEAALFADRYHCDAVALTDAVVKALPKAVLLAELEQAGGHAPTLVHAMARQLHALRQRLELRNVRSARERVLLALELRVVDESRTVVLEGPLQDLAADLGLTREALYRTLAALHASGQIVRDGSRITVRRPLGT
jgi:CRP/FNR family transcriptional regulator, dissimilatory nitrate respiration regulator